MTERRKLIEVALPLEAINREAAREKSIRHGHPSTLHLWWARRPLAAARAVLFAQLVDDPDSRPEAEAIADPDERAAWVSAERARLFRLIENLVKWENSTNERVLADARAEIMRSTEGNPPAILDPFAGGGTIPLEAQRLGLQAHASDLNPVAVLINKALIEIPPRFANCPPVFPGAADSRLSAWPRVTGLAEDVRRYGEWVRDKAALRIGHLYPRAVSSDGRAMEVDGWMWARVVTCVNPACGAEVPLISSADISRGKKRDVWLRPVTKHGQVEFELAHAGPRNTGNKMGSGARFECWVCRTPVSPDAVHEQLDGPTALPPRLLCSIGRGTRARGFLPPTEEDRLAIAQAWKLASPIRESDGTLSGKARGTFGGNAQGRRYGFRTFADYFTDRQLIALVTFSDLIQEAHAQILVDWKNGTEGTDAYGKAAEYADAVTTFLAFALSKVADRGSSLVSWVIQRESTRNTFARQAIAMAWDFVEMNPLVDGTGSFIGSVNWTANSIDVSSINTYPSRVDQMDAASRSYEGLVVTTDPPYYDNIVYSDLSDFFYVWLRRTLAPFSPTLFETVLVPKAAELVANQYRNGGKAGARRFFEDGFRQVFKSIRVHAISSYPTVVFYAFKQTETIEGDRASTGWATLLDGMIEEGWQITGTWPVRSERLDRTIGINSNALASSIVLALRPRPHDAEVTDRRGFIADLRGSLPSKLREMQQGSIAPVDLPQAAIGPGMAVYSRYSRVYEADGSAMVVQSALQVINQILAEVLSEQEGDFDSATRWCLKWFESNGFNQGLYGDAETLASAYNTSVSGLARSGALTSVGGKVQLFSPECLPVGYDPRADDHITLWEVVMHLVKALDEEGLDAAGLMMSRASTRIELDVAKELSYLVFSIAERNRWSGIAQLFNLLAASWADVVDAARRNTDDRAEQLTLESTY